MNTSKNKLIKDNLIVKKITKLKKKLKCKNNSQ